MSSTVGPMQGVVESITSINEELAGFAQTRLSSVVTTGDVVFPVESVVDWPSSGKALVFGTLYSYASRTDVTLEGITHTDGETVFVGAKVDIRIEATVTDFSQNRSAIDLLRRATLVNFAEGADLSTVGRNLGVLRRPDIADDEVFRAIIKALAYSPKGTVFGLELFLTAAVGAGNFTIFEDLINSPNKVFIKLLGSASLEEVSIGKAILNQSDLRPETSATSVTLPGPPDITTVYSVRFKDSDLLSDFRNQLPSAISIVEYPGDGGTTIWAYEGPSEGADVTQVAGLHIEIDDSSAVNVARYAHNLRAQPDSFSAVNIVQNVTSGGTVSGAASSGNQWAVHLEDDSHNIAWGIINIDASTYDIGFIDSSAGIFLSGSAAVLNKDQFYSVEVRKYGQNRAELFIDGSRVQTEAWANFRASTETRLRFGAQDSTLTGMIGQVKQVGFFSYTPTDFWAARGVDGEAFPAATSPKTFDDTVAAAFLAGDVGKRFVVPNATNDVNKGVYEVDTFVSASRLTLKGQDRIKAFVQSATPTTFFANDKNAFQFPDDIGKEIVISTGPNSGGSPYVITDLISELDGVTSLSSFDSTIPEKTGIAIASAATFVTETDIDWRLDPVFVNETSLDWELSDTGSEAAGVLTLRQSMPALTGAQTRILRVRYTDVLSSQIEEDSVVVQAIEDLGPPVLYNIYPFVLADPLGFVRFYLDAITVAGVIPVFLQE